MGARRVIKQDVPRTCKRGGGYGTNRVLGETERQSIRASSVQHMDGDAECECAHELATGVDLGGGRRQ